MSIRQKKKERKKTVSSLGVEFELFVEKLKSMHGKQPRQETKREGFKMK